MKTNRATNLGSTGGFSSKVHTTRLFIFHPSPQIPLARHLRQPLTFTSALTFYLRPPEPLEWHFLSQFRIGEPLLLLFFLPFPVLSPSYSSFFFLLFLLVFLLVQLPPLSQEHAYHLPGAAGYQHSLGLELESRYPAGPDQTADAALRRDQDLRAGRRRCIRAPREGRLGSSTLHAKKSLRLLSSLHEPPGRTTGGNSAVRQPDNNEYLTCKCLLAF